MRNAGRFRRGPDWEISPLRIRFLIRVFSWIVGTLLYAALAYFTLAITPAEYRNWVAVGAVVLYWLTAAVLVMIVARDWRRAHPR